MIHSQFSLRKLIFIHRARAPRSFSSSMKFLVSTLIPGITEKGNRGKKQKAANRRRTRNKQAHQNTGPRQKKDSITVVWRAVHSPIFRRDRVACIVRHLVMPPLALASSSGNSRNPGERLLLKLFSWVLSEICLKRESFPQLSARTDGERKAVDSSLLHLKICSCLGPFSPVPADGDV